MKNCSLTHQHLEKLTSFIRCCCFSVTFNYIYLHVNIIVVIKTAIYEYIVQCYLLVIGSAISPLTQDPMQQEKWSPLTRKQLCNKGPWVLVAIQLNVSE